MCEIYGTMKKTRLFLYFEGQFVKFHGPPVGHHFPKRQGSQAYGKYSEKLAL